MFKNLFYLVVAEAYVLVVMYVIDPASAEFLTAGIISVLTAFAQILLYVVVGYLVFMLAMMLLVSLGLVAWRLCGIRNRIKR